MKLIRIIAMLMLVCDLASGFPETSQRTAFKETFSGGTDPFDLNLHSLTLMPTDLGSGNAPSRYPSYYNVRPIRKLPVDMSEANVLSLDGNGDSAVIPMTGMPPVVIHGIPLTSYQVKRAGEVVLLNANATSSVTLRVLKSDAFPRDSTFQTGYLKFEANSLVTTDGRLAIQFDYSIDPEYFGNNALARPLVRNVFQAELFSNGMIRYSYFSVDVTVGEVGLLSSVATPANPDLDYSSAILKAPDVVAPENAGSAAVGLQLATNPTASNFQYATSSGSAITPSDYSAASGSSSIAGGTLTANLVVPVINDSLDEIPESFNLMIHAPGNPNWIFAEPRIWIVDDDSPASSSGPRIDRSGNRVIVLPPDPSAVTITGFRLLSVTGGTLLNPIDLTPIVPNSVFSLEAGAAGLIASGLGIHLTVEAIHSGGSSIPVGFDLDGGNASPVFSLTNDRIETTEGGFATLGVSASQAGASVAYQVFPLSAQPNADYAPAPKTLEFENGLAMIEIPVFSDGVTEGDEEFLVRLINPSPGSFIGPVSRARVVVKDGAGALRSPATQVLPFPRPTGRTVTRTTATTGWRFTGEPFWRPAGTYGWNAREGLHQVEFRVNGPARKFYLAPEIYLNQGSSTITDLDVSYANITPTTPTAPTGTGSLQLNLLPPAATGAQWRRKVENGLTELAWLNSGTTETLLPAGSYLVEFKDTVSGYDAPSLRRVVVQNNQTSVITATYQSRPVGATAPVAVDEPDLRGSTTTIPARIPISSQNSKFKVSFEFKPSSGSSSFVGLSDGVANTATDLVAALSADSTGFKVLHNSSYTFSPTSPPMTANQWHFVEFDVNPVLGTYILTVTPSAAAAVTVRSSATFRTPTPQFSNLTLFSAAGTCAIRGLRVDKNPDASSWRIIEFPDQTGAFDLALELKIRPPASGNPANAFPFSFGLSDGRLTAPTTLLGTDALNNPPQVNFVQPPNLGVTGRLAPLLVRLHVDLGTDHYQIFQGTDSRDSSTIPPAPLPAKVNHLYISENSNEIQDFKIADSILPPAHAVPSGIANAPNWIDVPLIPQTGRFSLTCDIRPVARTGGSGDLIDTLLGLSASKVTAENQIAVALQAKVPVTGTGLWEVYHGTYTHEGSLPVVDGKLYHATFHIDVPAKTYRISLAPDDGGPVIIREQGNFRQQATEIRYLTLGSTQGRLEVSNLRGPLPHPMDSPPHFTGQIESPNGFGTGTVVADHAVLTAARLVFDTAKLTFTPGISWRRSEGGYATIPDACEPSHIVLATGYASAQLNTTNGDSQDVAVLAFRPLDIPDSENAPGGGCFSGFLTDDGTGGWASMVVKSFPSFPMSGTTVANLGKVHTTALALNTFGSPNGLLHTASGIQAPPGSEGAAVFVQGTDKVFRPAAVCIGASGGIPKFRTIDAGLAEAIHQANSYQRLPGGLQELVKGGVYYINQTQAASTESNRAHILSNAIPPAAKWTLSRYGTSIVTSSGGQALSVEPGSYQVNFGPAPPGYTLPPASASKTRTLGVGKTWNLPAVYVAGPPSSYQAWVNENYDEFEALSPAAAAGAQTPWLGVDNLTAYAFGFDPKAGPVRYADLANGTPGYPRVTINPPTIAVELLRRVGDSNLVYEIQYSDTASSWSTLGTAPQIGPTLNGWQKVTWTFNPGQASRKFVRTRVTLAN